MLPFSFEIFVQFASIFANEIGKICIDTGFRRVASRSQYALWQRAINTYIYPRDHVNGELMKR